MECRWRQKRKTDGTYVFELIEIEKLSSYHIEFSYDGLKYQNVPEYNMNTWNAKVPNKYKTDKEAHNVANSSKAAEAANERTSFNEKFAIIEGNGTETGGVAKDSKGNNPLTLKYDITKKKKSEGTTEAKLTYSTEDASYIIKADTSTAGYNMQDHFILGTTETITDINLGLGRREEADLKIEKDLENVRVSINGYGHTYKYANRLKNNKKPSEDGFNVGVRYGRSTGAYRAAIYKSDYKYDSTDDSKELKVYVTYRIDLINNSSALKAKVNSIVDYYDSRYELIRAGYKVNETDGQIEDEIESKDIQEEGKHNDEYKKAIINTSKKVMDVDSINTIYVEFELNKEAVSGILEDNGNITDTKVLLDNVVEINSYSIYDKANKTYAAVDINSAPGNATPPSKEDLNKEVEDPETYENDTNLSPALKLEVANAREMTGTVFLDDIKEPEGINDTSQLMTGKERKGNGQYDNGEQGIAGVEVTLTEKSGSGKTYTAQTVVESGKYGFYQNGSGEWKYEKAKENEKYEVTKELNKGDFLIAGYIPGDYILTYKWGGQTYTAKDSSQQTITVQNYKGTIYDSVRNNKNQKDKNWYRNELINPRYTDATDDWAVRQEIDKEISGDLKYDWKSDEKITKKEMNSTTPEMSIGIENKNTTEQKQSSSTYEEYGKIITDSQGDELKYIISNIDFGIVERPRQDIELSKRISALKLTLEGEILVDVTIDKDGNMDGEKNFTTYASPSPQTIPQNGYIKLELDKELQQNLTLEVTYTFEVKNISELDYITEEYYKYGTNNTNSVTITPTAIIDYLDKDWAINESENEDWEIKTMDNIKNEDLIAKEVYNSSTSTNKDNIILYTKKLADKALTPTGAGGTNTNSVTLKVSKKLSPTDEISLDNETEIVKINKTGGSEIRSTPGNYVPGDGPKESDDSQAETTIVTPSTGANKNYVMPITIGITALTILGVGIIIIKKKAIRD